MNYYIDTEFIEDFHKPFLGKRRHYIDLISIAIVAQDGREYYAVSKEFDLKAVWNKADQGMPDEQTGLPTPVYWLRDNVLKPIYDSLHVKVDTYCKTHYPGLIEPFSLKALQTLINWYGKTNKQIAEEIKAFVYKGAAVTDVEQWGKKQTFDFYGYYCDYDWVLFCSLFGRMLDLPTGFPMYCRDLKQMYDELEYNVKNRNDLGQEMDYSLKEDHVYPMQTGKHHALADAHWNKQLHEFLIEYGSRPYFV